jgi:hypothetical protein
LENESMNINRKIQLAATLVIASGALALMSATPALAQGCPMYQVCVLGQCPANPSSYCPKHDPEEFICTFVAASCAAPINSGNCPGDAVVTCSYD